MNVIMLLKHKDSLKYIYEDKGVQNERTYAAQTQERGRIPY